ncbi:UBN2_3 domain-containing protein [Cephalotus follicularis]|uniref:UBN2_3 domain-containing protein n=1 Tax=Cephalotus follicularis TaxID=3775 RepID=A0A1Q3C0K9_CEPFO|nr:UBN2_3 domain-containing protein [Cephalotus follicularis]
MTTEVSRDRTFNISLHISSIKFNGTSYLSWSKACMLSVRATKLVGYLTGSTPRPTVGNDEKWLCEDALVMSWLLNSLEPALSPQYMMMVSAKDIWDAIAQQFSQGNNYAQAYEITKQAREMRQGSCLLLLITLFSLTSGSSLILIVLISPLFLRNWLLIKRIQRMREFMSFLLALILSLIRFGFKFLVEYRFPHHGKPITWFSMRRLVAVLCCLLALLIVLLLSQCLGHLVLFLILSTIRLTKLCATVIIVTNTIILGRHDLNCTVVLRDGEVDFVVGVVN